MRTSIHLLNSVYQLQSKVKKNLVACLSSKDYFLAAIQLPKTLLVPTHILVSEKCSLSDLRFVVNLIKEIGNPLCHNIQIICKLLITI
jgi:hypothetical protein